MISNDIRFLHLCARWFIKGTLSLFWGLKIQDLEFIPPEGRVIVAVNHLHWLDPLIAGAAIFGIRKPHFLAKEELFRNPISGRILRFAGAMPLNRDRTDFVAVRSAMEVLGKEGCVVLFPEGTRAKDGVSRKPKAGVALLAHQTGAPVIPARIRNTERFPALVPLSLRFGPAMRYEGDGGREAYQRFAERVMENIFRL